MTEISPKAAHSGFKTGGKHPSHKDLICADLIDHKWSNQEIISVMFKAKMSNTVTYMTVNTEVLGCLLDKRSDLKMSV